MYSATMKQLLIILLILSSCAFDLYSQSKIGLGRPTICEVDNSIFTCDKYWRGADGAASIDLGNGRLLWLFSDTFIDTKGAGQRRGATMINNSIAIQEGYNIDSATINYYYNGTRKKPKAFFELPGTTWFWLGHGTKVRDKLIIFLFEEKSTTEGLGFQAIGWYMVIINNPDDIPSKWVIEYYKGSEPSNILVGSSAVLADDRYIYAYGVKEPSTHEVYLIRFNIDNLMNGDLEEASWWVNDRWVIGIEEEPIDATLFFGQTEFSVHYEPDLNQFIQVQTYGFGHASIGYRLADQPQGPWSDPKIIYKPKFEDSQEFVYSANAHPGLISDGILITYNINNFDFKKLVDNEEIYFPKIIRVKF